MAILTTVATGVSVAGKIGGLFGGGGKNFAQQNRNRKRAELQSVGFNWRKTSGVPAGEEWNIDNYSDEALDNMARAYDRFGDIVPKLHNEKAFRNDSVARNYDTVQQIVLAAQDDAQPTAGAGVDGFFSAGAGGGIGGDKVQALVFAALAFGGLLFFMSKN